MACPSTEDDSGRTGLSGYLRKPDADVWGDTVNTASRMESHGLPGRIQVTDAVRAELEGGYQLVPRGKIDVKGKGPMPTWWLDGHGAAR